MNAQDIPNSWSQSEWAAREYIEKTAGWINQFYCQQSGYFYVAFTRGPSLPPDPDPNSASCIVGGVVARSRDILLEPIVSDSVEQLIAYGITMRDAMRGEHPARLLPLKSFGFLPLFSTSYLAQYLPTCYEQDPNELIKDGSYLIAIRRILADLIGHASATLDRTFPHAFLLSHMLRALRTFRGTLDKFAPGAFDEIRQPDKLRERLIAELSAPDADALGSQFDRELSGPLQNYFDHPLKNLVSECMAIVEDLALKAVLTEIANSHRASPVAVDPASLAFGMLALVEADNYRYASVVTQGIDLLTKMSAGGFFASGKPFFSDDRARSLLVPSVETANALIALSLNPNLTISEAQLSEVVATTNDVQQRLMEEHNTIGVAGTPCEGWCSDRASTPDRVESWVTAHALEFFVNRIRLLRAVKRKRVFSTYNSRSSKKVEPKWEDLLDPDEGHCDNTLKKKIEEGLTQKGDGKAPVFLMFGPPGTSKTTVAKSAATINKLDWDLLLLSPSDFVSESLDKIEYQSRRVFDDLMNVDRCVVIFDEVDALFRNRQELRKRSPGSILEFVVPALLPKLQDFRDYALNRDIMIFFLTNYLESIDPAISRGGRIDTKIVVLPYSKTSRKKVASEFYKKAIGKRPNEFDKLAELLDRLPCNLVYRDIEIIARAAGRGPFEEDAILRNVDRLGVKPEAYLPSERKGAEHEFCMFFSRLISYPFPKADLNERGEMADYLAACAKQVPKDDRFEKWKDLAKQWQQALRAQKWPIDAAS